ncbi:ExeM/NucH family extracellular endonuclease [Rheinheimera metallidurans]|uniref:ExeM/NucH family extracellular endonuclease n=1 Tax=Rheinheimera metallidurans TaxID=2925781 RepID=UPI003002390A
MNNAFVSLSLLSTAIFSGATFAQCNADFTSIYTIQGTAKSSALQGQQLSTRGVVTAQIYLGSKAAGITLRAIEQGNAQASASLFIADTNAATAYQPGQLLQISGIVTELHSQTSLIDISDITVCDTGLSVTAREVQLPLTSMNEWEKLEGELIQFSQTLTVNDTYDLGRYGEVILADKRLMVATEIMQPGKNAAALTEQQRLHTVVVDDGLYQQNPDPLQFGGKTLTAENTLRVGDTVQNVQGVVVQDDRGYRVVPTRTPVYIASNPRPENPAAKPAKALRIASFNVLNFFNGTDQTPSFPTRRGADTLAEFERQQAKTVTALAALDADVIGLLEVENNGYGAKSALASLTTALNKVTTKPYRFIITSEQPGNDVIKVALLYRPATVGVEGKAAMLFNKPFDWGSRPPLAQSFRHLASNELVTVSINHFKSKGSCPKDRSTKNADQHDGQGCWNALRTTSAQALSDWLKTQPTGVKTNKQIILGDLNAYRMEDPVQALRDENWQYLHNKDTEQYSFVYRGRSGSLDHALASPELAKQLKTLQHWTINADEPTALDYNLEFKSNDQQQQLYAPNPYRSSDHDPLIATFEF